MKVKMIATDLDGTLLAPGGQVMTDRNRVALSRAIELGVIVVICTGRMYSAAARYALELGGDQPVVAVNGAVVRMSRSGKYLRRLGIDPQSGMQAFSLLDKAGAHPWAYLGDVAYIERVDDDVRAFVQRTHADIKVVPNVMDIVEQRPEKILGHLPPEQAIKFIAELSRYFGEKLYCTRGMHNQVECLDPHGTKGEGLSFVAEKMGIAKENIMGLGDSYNDLPLFQGVGIKVAMGDGEQSLKEAADWVTGSCADSGVAQAVERALSLQE